MTFLQKIFSLKDGEFKLLALSFAFIFALFSSYSLLRPVRDALGLSGGESPLTNSTISIIICF